MSYILEALRKADAQRERDSSRGIHAQPAPLGRAADDRAAPRVMWTAGALVAVVAAAAAGWYASSRHEPVPQAPAQIAAPVAPPPAAPAVAPARTEIAPPAPPALPAPTAAAAPALAGLPPDAPRFAISGGVYSPSPAQRMLIVGGQVFNEGSEIAPGVTIDEIKPRTAVLKFRGARYIVAY